MSILNLFGASRRAQSVPIFPLNTVLFPGALLPLRIFEARYMDMAKECLKRSSPFGVCLITEGEEVGTPAAHERVGCLAHVRRRFFEALSTVLTITDKRRNVDLPYMRREPGPTRSPARSGRWLCGAREP